MHYGEKYDSNALGLNIAYFEDSKSIDDFKRIELAMQVSKLKERVAPLKSLRKY